MSNCFSNELDLKHLSEKYKIDSDEVLSEITMIIDKKILARHFYDIYEGKDGRWHSYLPDEEHKRKRKPIAKKSRANLEKTIIDFYKSETTKESRKDITLRDLYPEWFEYKSLEIDNSNYLKRITLEWNKYYQNDEMIDIPIRILTTHKLKKWALEKIRKNKLTNRQYYNMQIIIRQSLDYLVEIEELPMNPYNLFKIPRNLFTPVPKKKAVNEVYSPDEEERIKTYAMQDFIKNQRRSSSLAIVLNFSLGLRVGELAALKWEDLNEEVSSLCITRMEQRQYIQNGTNMTDSRLVVVEHTKNHETRTIYVTQAALGIFSLIKKYNQEQGYDCSSEAFIFQHAGKRINCTAIIQYYTRYCKILGIPLKSNHKVRKTCLSKIADNPNLKMPEVMNFSGHKDEKTFFRHYYFSRRSDEQVNSELEKALST